MTKVCARCGDEKPLDDFKVDKRMKLGRASYCYPCMTDYAREWYAANLDRARAATRRRAKAAYTKDGGRRRHLKAKYGITPEEVAARLATQGGCAICHTDKPGGKGDWHIDHCHDSGLVRGVLCATCNVGLGLMGDDAARLRAAADYLDHHNGEQT